MRWKALRVQSHCSIIPPILYICQPFQMQNHLSPFAHQRIQLAIRQPSILTITRVPFGIRIREHVPQVFRPPHRLPLGRRPPRPQSGRHEKSPPPEWFSIQGREQKRFRVTTLLHASLAAARLIRYFHTRSAVTGAHPPQPTRVSRLGAGLQGHFLPRPPRLAPTIRDSLCRFPRRTFLFIAILTCITVPL